MIFNCLLSLRERKVRPKKIQQNRLGRNQFKKINRGIGIEVKTQIILRNYTKLREKESSKYLNKLQSILELDVK